MFVYCILAQLLPQSNCDITDAINRNSLQAIATRLTEFSKVYPRILTAYSTHLIQRWKQNKQKRIQIGVLGCEKSGKKTLLNAIVGNRCLSYLYLKLLVTPHHSVMN